MHQADAIAVEVTISPELRHLLAARRTPAAAKPPADPGPEPDRAQSDEDMSVAPGRPSGRILLRQDGAKPVRFLGSEIFRVEGHWPEGTDAFAHEFALFVDAAGGLHAAVSLNPDERQGIRPSYRYLTLESGLQLRFWLGQWVQEIVGPALAQQTPYRRLAPDKVLAAFHSLTGQCLQSVDPLFERKEQCLQ